MIILIPMAGQSSRFRNAGYPEQKFRLSLNDGTVFDHAVSSFDQYFQDATFLFATRSSEDAKFAAEHAAALGIKDFHTHIDENPKGFHDTVFKSLTEASIDLNQPIILHAVDTFRPGFTLPDSPSPSGYIESCYQDSKSLRSFYKFVGRSLSEPEAGQTKVLKSRRWAALLRGTGLYYFPDAANLIEVYKTVQKKRENSKLLARFMSEELLEGFLFFRELVATRAVDFRLVRREDVTFCGIPKEYEELKHAAPR